MAIAGTEFNQQQITKLVRPIRTLNKYKTTPPCMCMMNNKNADLLQFQTFNYIQKTIMQNSFYINIKLNCK